MKNNKIQSVVLVLLTLLTMSSLTVLLNATYFGYVLYAVIAVLIFSMARVHGIELYLYLFLFMQMVSKYFIKEVFIVDYFNLTGYNPLNLHVITIIWLIIFFLEFLRDFILGKIKLDKINVWTYSIAIIFIVVTVWKRGTNGFSQNIECFLGPLLFYAFYHAKKPLNHQKVMKVVNLLLIVSVLYSFYGIFEYIAKENYFDFLYVVPQDRLEFYDPGQGYRIKTLLGHPLNNAVFFLTAMVFANVFVKREEARYFILIVNIIAVALTGSRSMLALGILLLMYNPRFFQGKIINFKKFLLPIICVSVTILTILYTPLGGTILTRMFTQSSSIEARTVLVQYFVDHIFTSEILGVGGSSNLKILNSQGQAIILENPWIMLYLEMGVLSIPYFAFVGYVFYKSRYKLLIGIFIIALSTFDSFGVKSTCNYLLFFIFVCLNFMEGEKKCESRL